MPGSVGDHKTFTGLEMPGGLSLDQDFHLAFHHVADFLAKMGMAARSGTNRNFHAGHHGLAARDRDVLALNNGPLNPRILCRQRSRREDQPRRAPLGHDFQVSDLLAPHLNPSGGVALTLENVPPRTWLCLFDLRQYDERLAPALRAYAHEFQPAKVVELLRELARRPGPEARHEDYQHWIDSVGPDAGYKPSSQTIAEICGMLVPGICLPELPGIHAMQDLDRLAPWLAPRSEWFADLMEGGEELAGGRLEFSFGTGSLVSTREQVAQFLAEIESLPPPEGDWRELAPDFENLHRLVAAAASVGSYTLLKTGV